MIIFQQSRIERSSTVIAFGGGVVGDMTGFAASVCLRGIGYIQVPTSLLAMVDSSVGGKTAVDHPLGKNLIGAFYQPKLVYIDTDFLNTLSERDFLSGYAELFKYAFIGGRKMFDFIMNNNETMLRKESGILLEGISHSIETKARVVEQDQFETSGLRALLNFGHTFAHSLERFTIDLENLVLTLSCSDEDTIYDTTMLSGTGGEDFTINVGNLAAPKQWRVTAASYDQNDSCIHFGSESFITEPADTVDVALNLSARYSMLRVSFIGIPDSVLALSVILNGAVTLDTSFTVAGSTDTAVLWYDYIDASPEGNNHLVSMRVRGVYHGINTILFSADTSISVVSGEDHEYTVTLGWVGPYINNAPVFTSEPSNMVDSVIAGSRYLDTVHVYDPDSDAVTLSLSGTLLADSILNVPTTLADTGTYPIQLIASDGNGGYDTLEWTIFIVPPPASNHSPHFTILSSEMQSVVYVDSHYTDTVHATDDDGDQITYILLDNTNSLVIADDSILTWTPTEDDIGTHRVSVIADDGNGGTDTLSWNISVISVTSPPYPLISFDSPMIGEINPNVDVDRYWFNGTAGDIITLRVDPDGNGSSLDPDSRIQIVGPDDSVVLDHSVNNGILNAIEDYELPLTGQYIIRVMESHGNETFNYEIVLYSLQHSRENGIDIDFAIPAEGGLASKVSVNRYLFSGTEGDIITLRVDPDGNGSSLDPDSRIQIVGPDDSVVLDQSVNNGILNAFEDYELTSSGRYTIRVMESNGDQVFGYTILLIN